MPARSIAIRRHSREFSEIERLRWELMEAKETLAAIRSGSVDALVVDGPTGTDRIFTLEGAEHAYRLFVETMSEGAVTLDEDGTVQYCNARFADMIGLPLQNILGEHFLTFVSSDCREPLQEQLLVAESDWRRDISLEGPGGEAIPALLSFHTILHPAPRSYLVVTDLTELKRAERAERAHLARLRQMVACLPMAVAAVDEHDLVLEVNAEFCRMFDIGEPADLIGKNRWEFINHMKEKVVEPSEFEALVRSVDKSATPVLEYELRFRDGRIVVRDYIPIFEEGAYRGQLLLYRDVTKERRINASKSEFMSLASHQLRSPLTAIRWSFARLTRTLPGVIGPADQGMLEEGQRAANRMFETINTMLSISRIESGSVTPTVRSISLKRLFHDIVAMSEDMRRARKQEVSVQCAQNLTLRTDESFLKEILGNLLNNALKYSKDGQKVILRAIHTQNGVRIDVEDHGYGIPMHQQDKIFQKFFRGDNVVERVTDGTGLGLYLVSLLVHTLHGTITFTSREGKGTTFSLTLPSLHTP